MFAPFGVEALQIFATNQNIINSLPGFATQKIGGEIYEGVIVNSEQVSMPAKQAISKVRGIKKESKKNQTRY